MKPMKNLDQNDKMKQKKQKKRRIKAKISNVRVKEGRGFQRRRVRRPKPDEEPEKKAPEVIEIVDEGKKRVINIGEEGDEEVVQELIIDTSKVEGPEVPRAFKHGHPGTGFAATATIQRQQEELRS